VSRFGVTPNAWSVDTVGPITTTVHDAALVLHAIAGADRRDPTTAAVPVPDYPTTIGAGVRGLRIGIPRDHFFDGAHGDVEQAVRDAAAVLARHGARIVETRVPHAGFAAVARTLHLAEAASFHEERLRKEPHLLGSVLRRRLETARSYLATDYIKALRVRAVLVGEISRAFDACDVLAVPTDRNLPPLVVSATGAGGTGGAAGGNTFLASMTGVPAMAVPCGFSAGPPRLPVSVMLHARPFDESVLFKVGHAFQAVTEWHRMVPAVDVQVPASPKED
jgi:aspartyl-tRNA(Asn)/glutamyl-tRNA(Gln) amidotransferase subunit A